MNNLRLLLMCLWLFLPPVSAPGSDNPGTTGGSGLSVPPAWRIVGSAGQMRGLPDVSAPTLLLPAYEGVAREDVAAARSRGFVPLGLLDVGFYDQRLQQPPVLAIDRLRFLLPRWRSPRLPVRFYLEIWKKHLQQRLEMLAGIGCRGIVLAGAHVPRIISSQPLTARHMHGLLCWTLAEIRRRCADAPIFLLLESPELWQVAAELPVTGVIVEGFLHHPSGRRRHAWLRSPQVAHCQRLQTQGKVVLSIEPTNAQTPYAAMLAELASCSVLPAQAQIPLMSDWRFLP